jgi:serine/threonine protein kinase
MAATQSRANFGDSEAPEPRSDSYQCPERLVGVLNGNSSSTDDKDGCCNVRPSTTATNANATAAAADMWALGCCAGELFLGRPILEAKNEHDLLVQITEGIAYLPQWMLNKGKATNVFYCTTSTATASASHGVARERDQPLSPHWRLKSIKEYANDIVANKGRFVHRNVSSPLGGAATSPRGRQGGIPQRAQKRRLADWLLLHHGQDMSMDDEILLPAFVHFLYGVLDPDPTTRLTAFQALAHPFVTGNLDELRPAVIRPGCTGGLLANRELGIFWQVPPDPNVAFVQQSSGLMALGAHTNFHEIVHRQDASAASSRLPPSFSASFPVKSSPTPSLGLSTIEEDSSCSHDTTSPHSVITSSDPGRDKQQHEHSSELIALLSRA